MTESMTSAKFDEPVLGVVDCPLFGVAVADGEAVGSIWEIWPLRPEKARMPMEMPTAKHSTAMHTCIQILL